MKLQYNDVLKAKFLERVNRFRCKIDVNGHIYSAHIHDPGRLSELLKFNSDVLIRPHTGLNAKTTDFYLFAVNSNDGWVLVDSALHNNIFLWILNSNFIPDLDGFKIVKREYKFMDSKYDFLLKSPLGKNCLLEVKGCTLVVDGVAMFPDAPTVRGMRHVYGLIHALNSGYDSIIVFLITHPGAKIFKPNWIIDEALSKSLLEAYEADVKIYACKVFLMVYSMSLIWGGLIPVILK
ncbi:MAG: DNA/RNA nuclease SfsA [Candidatus Methanomethylicia archaeon]